MIGIRKLLNKLTKLWGVLLAIHRTDEVQTPKANTLKSNQEERIKSLELAIDEQRRDWDSLSASYETARLKNVTLLGAAFAFSTYLYSANDPKRSLRERLFYPYHWYWDTLYIIAFVALISAIILLLFALKPQTWSTAYDDEQDDSSMNSYPSYLEYMHKRYLRSSGINRTSYTNRQELLDTAFPLLIGGGIMLLVIRILVS
jgi:hypothetical protein